MARGRKSSLHIILSPEEHQTLERWQRATTITAGLARRAKIILLLAAGYSQSNVAQLVGVQRRGPQMGQAVSHPALGWPL